MIEDMRFCQVSPLQLGKSNRNRILNTRKGLVIKYRGGGPAEIGGGSSIFKLRKRGGSPKYWSCL